VTAIANMFLVPWLLISLIYVSHGGYQGAVEFIASPLNAVLILVAVGSVLYHMRIGMQVVIEDYIARTGTRLFLLLLNTFFSVALFAAAAFAVFEIAT
jgi:succinate dehydrogenase / fumarate reductase membrane anchor subunit